MPTSIKSVAQRAGVSPSTVSKVLNDAPSFSVPSETRHRIQQAAEELGYVPNRMAQSLGRGKSEMVGVVVAALKNPFFAELVEAVENHVTERGFHALIEIAPEVGSQFVKRGNLSGWLLDGMLVWSNPWYTQHNYEPSRSYVGPLVYMGYPRTDDHDWVAFDLYSGGRLIAEHVYDAGYQKVWYITPFQVNAISGIEERARAFSEVSRERGVEGKIVASPRREESREMGIEMAAQIACMPARARPDALICHNDLVAIGVFHGLRRQGLRVPQDIAVTGFDGLSESQCLDLPLTTVKTSIAQMAQCATNILFERMSNSSLVWQHKLLPCELLVGGTTKNSSPRITS